MEANPAQKTSQGELKRLKRLCLPMDKPPSGSWIAFSCIAKILTQNVGFGMPDFVATDTLAVIAWNSCSDFVLDKVSNSIFYRPLEDWMRC